MTATPTLPQAKRSALVSVAKWALVCLLLALFVVFFGRVPGPTGRAVIISSDDAGMCAEVNQGTIEALRSGIVRSTSLMTCCPGFDDFARFAIENPQYGYGVHLTLTCDLRPAGWGPVSNPDQVPSLVGDDGFLHPGTMDVAKNAVLAEVETELRAQIRKALDRGIRITHLDHHMWVLFARPDFLELYERLGTEFGLPIRLSRQPPERQMRHYGDAAAQAYTRLVQSLQQRGQPLLDSIESANYSVAPGEKRAYFIQSLRNLPPGVTEIVIHCASPIESEIDPPDALARYADTQTFSVPEIRAELERLRIRSLNWGEFATEAGQ